LSTVTKDVAAVTAEDALSYSWSGPLLRAAGVDYDVRAMEPYSSYEEFLISKCLLAAMATFTTAFWCGNEEMWQSLRLIEQALKKIEGEPSDIFHADVPEFYLPPKEEVYNNMEALIYHFKS